MIALKEDNRIAVSVKLVMETINVFYKGATSNKVNTSVILINVQNLRRSKPFHARIVVKEYDIE